MKAFNYILVAMTFLIVSPAQPGHAAQAGVAEMVRVPMLKRAVKSGAVISSRDITMANIDARKANVYAVRDSADIIGMAARRPLMPGRVLRQNDFEVPAVVFKGARVTMVLSAGGLRLTAIGTALEDGRDGAAIRVRNIETNQTVYGQVISSNIVEVLPVGQLALR